MNFNKIKKWSRYLIARHWLLIIGFHLMNGLVVFINKQRHPLWIHMFLLTLNNTFFQTPIFLSLYLVDIIIYHFFNFWIEKKKKNLNWFNSSCGIPINLFSFTNSMILQIFSYKNHLNIYLWWIKEIHIY